VTLPILNAWSVLRSVRREKFDLLLDFGVWARINAIIAHAFRAKYKIGFETPKQHRHYVYDLCIRHSTDKHEFENFRDLLRAIGIAPSNAPHFPDSVGTVMPARFRPTGKYVVFHLWPSGIGSHTREWPAERWIALGSFICAAGYRIALTGGPVDREKNDLVADSAARHLKGDPWINCAGIRIEETIAVLRNAELVVSVNTGVLHVAAALDRPVIGLHGPTSVRHWGPLGRRSKAVSAPRSDCGYVYLGAEYRHDCDCMRTITIEAVRAAVSAQLHLLD
jgi:heptosyltransferase I